jgi:hypothetical protein
MPGFGWINAESLPFGNHFMDFMILASIALLGILSVTPTIYWMSGTFIKLSFLVFDFPLMIELVHYLCLILDCSLSVSYLSIKKWITLWKLVLFPWSLILIIGPNICISLLWRNVESSLFRLWFGIVLAYIKTTPYDIFFNRVYRILHLSLQSTHFTYKKYLKLIEQV